MMKHRLNHGLERELLPEVAEMKEESDDWLVCWEDGTVEQAPCVGIAWCAREFDDEAEVIPV